MSFLSDLCIIDGAKGKEEGRAASARQGGRERKEASASGREQREGFEGHLGRKAASSSP